MIAAVTALGILLLGFAGLGVDMGYLRYEKRLQQTAADGAAIAGAAELLYGGDVTAAANHDAAANGFLAATANINQCPPPAPATPVASVSVTVNNPPCSGPHSGDRLYVEVYVAQVQPTFFMHILGINSETVTARAVAVLTGNRNACLYALGTFGDGILLDGNDTITGTSCGIVDYSNLGVNGNAAINARTIGDVTGSCGPPNCTPAAVTGIVAGPDPLAYLTAPPTGGTCLADPNLKGNGNQVLFQGNYCSGISISGNVNVTFNPGVYTLGGSFSASGNGTLTGNGVMFYNTAGTISLNGNNTINFSAPAASDVATGAIAGILFWQASGDTNGATFNGNNGSTLQGMFYFPGAQVTMNGNNSAALYTMIVAQSLRMNGSNTLTLSANTSSLTGGSPIKDAVLVE